jgi:glutathione S-transferase
MTLALYHNDASTCSQKVRICLAEKQIEWENHHINLGAHENLQPAYLAVNPNGVVPAMTHDGRAVIESTVMCEYLDEVFETGPRLLPVDAVDRAAMRAWLRYIDEVPSMAVRVPTFNDVLLPTFQQKTEAKFAAFAEANPLRRPFFLRMGREGFSAAEYEIAMTQLAQNLDRMEAALADGPWLLGVQYTIADICMAPLIARMDDLGLWTMWADTHVRVEDWYGRVAARPAFIAAFYPGARMIDVFPELAAKVRPAG